MLSASELSSDLTKMSGKPAYIEFSTVAKHMAKQSEAEGRYVAIDIDMVTVRQIGAADSCVFKVQQWLDQNKIDAKGGRLPHEHADYYEKAYKRWKAGQEMPVEGTPIKTWPVISPAQVSLLVSLGIRTVEDLASVNDEAKVRIGMGAIMLKNSAQAWLDQAKDKGPLTMQMAKVQAENDLLKMNLSSLTEQVGALQEQVKANKEENEQAARKGRPRKEA